MAGQPTEQQADEALEERCIEVVAGMFGEHDLPRTPEGWLTPVDWGLASEPMLFEKAIAERALSLSPTRAETFLAEVAAALNELRQVGQRYDDLRRQVTALAIDRLEQESEERIRDQEVADGFLDIESRVADAEADGQSKWSAATDESARTIEVMQADPFFAQVLADDPHRVAHIRAYLNVAGLYSAYKTVHDRETPDKAHLDNNTIWITDPYNVPPGSRAPDIVPDRTGWIGLVSYRQLQYRATFTVAGLESYAQKTQLISQSALSRGLAGSASDTAQARRIWADWKKAEVEHRRARTDLRRLLNAVKRRASDEAGAPMEFGREFQALRSSFASTLSTTLAKMDVAKVAIERMFGVGPLTPRPSPGTWNDRKGSFLAGLTGWHAELRAALDEVLGIEGSELVAVSLATLIGRQRFDAIAAAARTAKSETLHYEFQLPNTLFSGMEAIRIAGVTAYARNKAGTETGPWRARVRPPVTTRNIISGVPTPPYDQPPRWTDLGRISSRRSMRPPDINGLAALRNLQPLSGAPSGVSDACWQLEVVRRSLAGEDAWDLIDLELELILNMRRV